MRDRGHPDDLLSAFLDDELDEASALRVTRHLADCPDCLAELEGLRVARSAVRGLPDIPAPPTSLFAAVPEVAAHAPSGRGRLAVVGVAAGLAALLTTAFVMGDGEPGDVVPPVEVVVVDHVARTGGGPMIQPVDLDHR